MTKTTSLAIALTLLVVSGGSALAAGPCRTSVCRKAANKCARAICRPVHGVGKGYCLRAYRNTFSRSCQANAVDAGWCKEVVQYGCGG